MSEKKTRRLVAIMFADVVGYTAMMQRNEQEGLAKVHRFSEVVEAQVKSFHGEILEFKGDGCLVVFESAVEAMHSAKAIQDELKQAPQVPLRIGIHIGDIVFTRGNIYGDGVNLASRIESMGVPGSILVTEQVISNIQSHPEFEMASLGRFQFKNVEKPMEVFALANEGFAVPRPEEMKGKGEKVKKKNPVLLASLAIVAMIVGAVLFWAFGSFNTGQKLLAEDIRDEKVAVSVFENRTGDKNLDALGYLGSEWISSGLRELKVRTVSPEMVRQNKEIIGILPNNPNGEASFAEITGAKYVIAGSYYSQGDSIILNTRLSSTETGEVVYDFPNLIGHKDKKEALVEDARQYLLGYWVAKKNQGLPNISPPKYEAYQIYLTCLLNQPNCYKKALEIDPDLMLARAWLMYIGVRWSEDSLYFPHKSYMEERWEKCTAFEKNLFLFASNMWEGDFQAAFDAIDANYRLDSTDYVLTHVSARILSEALNQPEKASKRFQRIFEKITLFEREIHPLSYDHYMSSLNQMGAFKEASNFFESLSEKQKKENARALMSPLIASYIYQNRIDEVKQLIDNWGDMNEDHIEAVYYYSCIYPKAIDNPFAEGLRKKMEIPWEYDLNRWSRETKVNAHYILKEWDAAEDSLLNINKRNANQQEPNQWIEYNIAANLGAVYAHQGRREEALQQLEKVKELGALYFDQSHANLVRGTTTYFMARIHAVLGDKEKAVELLQISRNQGLFITDHRFTLDPDFGGLQGYEPFEALIRPK